MYHSCTFRYILVTLLPNMPTAILMHSFINARIIIRRLDISIEYKVVIVTNAAILNIFLWYENNVILHFTMAGIYYKIIIYRFVIFTANLQFCDQQEFLVFCFLVLIICTPLQATGFNIKYRTKSGKKSILIN